MDDKHDPNGSVPAGTFRAADEGHDGDNRGVDSIDEIEIPIEIVLEEDQPRTATLHGTGALSFARSSDGDAHPDGTPRRKRTSTLMGVPYPGRSNVVGPNDLPLDEISNAIDAMLEDQPTHVYAQSREERPTDLYERPERPTTVYTRAARDARDERSPLTSGDSRDPALEAMLQSNSIARPDAMPPGEIIDVVAHRKDDTYELDVIDRRDSSKVPVLAPAQFVEARERDSRAAALRFARDDAAYEALPDDTEHEPAEHEPPRERKPSPVIEAAREPARATGAAPTTRTAPAPSSLAPLEVTRPRAAQPPKPRREAASPAGYAMVAAMVLVGIGGWWLTAGGFERSSQPMAAAGIPPKAPSPPSAPSARKAAPESSARVLPAPATPTVAVATQPAAKPIGHVVRKGATPAAPAPTEDAVDTPTRSQVIAGLNGVRPSVQACADGRSGVAEVDLTIAANGVVTHALVGGDFGGTPQGSCIARAVRKARFPEFKRDRFRLLYPYAL